MSEVLVDVKNLKKYFPTGEKGKTVKAVDDISFQIYKGETLGVVGESGCGKSTLLNILGLLDNPTSGSYKLFGKEVANLKENERTQLRKGNIGFVFQNFNLIEYESANCSVVPVGCGNSIESRNQ